MVFIFERGPLGHICEGRIDISVCSFRLSAPSRLAGTARKCTTGRALVFAARRKAGLDRACDYACRSFWVVVSRRFVARASASQCCRRGWAADDFECGRRGPGIRCRGLRGPGSVWVLPHRFCAARVAEGRRLSRARREAPSPRSGAAAEWPIVCGDRAARNPRLAPTATVAPSRYHLLLLAQSVKRSVHCSVFCPL